jgi:hypothetical protein
MKALRTVGRALLIALFLATVTLGGGLLTLPLTLRPLTPLDRMLAVPMGAALIWLGYARWSERRGAADQRAPSAATPQLRGTSAE